MIERGKYQSLTMVNWNGFFARSFDIDELVTTLSGGNGAGKSTTMAAFIAALIPDQSLLHFRNTTEAGSSQASRDKGLFGKLQPGACYSALDIINSKKQRVLFGIRLQQVVGRDKKVDIKPFLIENLPTDIKPTDILVEPLADSSARVRPINDVKQAVGQLDGVTLKVFSSVVEYHSQMFALGVLPKKLRTSGDRSKFYRLIEASLYGGISSAITRSLRDYLLPANGGVKKAFQDMESALRENRLTLEAIKSTQADRDLFKHLITESTNYVASDYMRHNNDRKERLNKALSLRTELYAAHKALSEQHGLLINLEDELERVTERENQLEGEVQAATDYLQQVQTALKYKDKIERYQEDLSELSERLEEQLMVVEESHEALAECEEQADKTEQEVDSLQMQLADFQQALDVQQTRALQYQQALECLTQVRLETGIETLTIEDVTSLLTQLKKEETDQTHTLLSLKHKLDVSNAEIGQFDQVFEQLKKIAPNANRYNAYECAKDVIAVFDNHLLVVSQKQRVLEQLQQAKQKISQQKMAQEYQLELAKVHSVDLAHGGQLNELTNEYQDKLIQIENELERYQDQLRDIEHTSRGYREALIPLQANAPVWLKANDALEKLREQSGETLTSSQAVMGYMQTLLEREKVSSIEKVRLANRREELTNEIEALSSEGGATDPRFKAIADALGGVLLSEIYDDIALSDAPFFSAMYGPARNAVVVSDLHGVKQKLTQLQDCPEDVYIIEGDVNAFDDSTMNVEELVGAVYVQANDQLVRYSVFPDVPLFGRAAREHRLEQLRSEREEIVEEYAKAAFDSQKLLRSYQSVADFVSQHIEQAFQQDPENRIDELNSKLIESRSQSETVRFELVEAKSQLENAKQVLSLLSGITPVIHLVDDDSLLISEQAFLKNLKEIKQSEVQVAVLEPSIESLRFELDVLKYDPQQHNTIEQEYQALDERLRDLKRKQFLLADLKERQSHFAYEDSTELLEQSSELSNNLRHKLSAADQNRGECRRHLKIAQEQFNQYNQVLVSLKTAHQAKAEMVEEFQQELQVVGVSIEDGVEEETIKRKEQLLATRLNIRDDKNSIQKRLTALEIDLKIVAKTIKSTSKTYRELRHIVVVAKANWCQVQRLARDNDVERRLNKRELAYLTAEELRSMSDKSLGALRVAVAGNSELRDALRASEETAYPVRKVMFFIAVYQHLKQRIRQDIIRTSDPVEAIEEMEIELARLTEELSMRENRLAISSDSVAAIIKKTIQREQVRIRLLNQGLSDITFGQVSGVRLNVNVRESHALLLSNLSEQQEQHSDLFKSSQLTFSESIAKLFQRVNPHIDMGQRSPQVLGEELLDYRSYLELSIEVNRGAEGWLQAESGALSTGEAIGTGQSILMMVIQSWEEESRRLRSKDIVPCRLLFLDEAARLDSKSISTLFELCDRLDMQLLIAAPENISPEQGTTYKLVRKVFNGREHVHVVGLKGFKKRATNLPLLEAG